MTTSSLESSLHRAGIADLYEKVAQGERLSFEDGMRLHECRDVNAVGFLANLVRERMHGNAACFVRNRHVNYTNICGNGCRFCCFACGPRDPGAYVLSPDDVAALFEGNAAGEIREVHVVGGVNPELKYDYYLNLVRTVRECCPRATVKAFTMVELDRICRVSGKSAPDTLEDLKRAGVDCCPGGGAEVLSDRIRRELFPNKLSPDGWLRMARRCHEAGLLTNATMLYGHIETAEERVRHLIRLRELQDETGGFQAFIPLAYHPGDGAERGSGTSGVLDLRMIALARLVLDNFPHIKAYWVMITPRLAQVGLHYGADDLDGTIEEERITHEAGARTPKGMDREELVRLIREAGRVPVERDGMYNKVETSPGAEPPG
jgi:aminodeoxyfutalosine synthase